MRNPCFYNSAQRLWASSSVQFSPVAQSCPTLCDPMNRSTPGLPVHHQLPEFTQTHVHRVSDAIQPSHSLSSPSPPAPNPSQHQILFHLSHQGSLRILEWVAYPFSRGSSDPGIELGSPALWRILYQLGYQGNPQEYT